MTKADLRKARTAHLRAVGKARKAQTETAIRAAVQALHEARERITVASVAKRAGVTRQTVYASVFRQEIEELRARTGNGRSPNVRAQASPASLQKRLEVLQQEVKRLEGENQKLQATINALLVQLRQEPPK